MAVGLVASLSLAGCDPEPDPGPFEPPPEDRVFENMSGFRAHVGRAFTFAFLFVENYGDQAAVLDGVQLVDPSGGIELVGSRVADITGEPTTSGDERFPPRRPTGQQLLRGFRVAPNGTQDAQILLGIRLTEEGQHGFRAVAVLYHVGESSFRYVIPSGVVACSPSYYEESGRRSCDADVFQRSSIGSGG